MSEPTIDQILIWVSGLEHWNPDTLSDNKVMLRAIRAILELHKRMHDNPLGQDWALEAIRAFVERVRERFGLLDAKTFSMIETALLEELDEMEKETNATAAR